MSLIDDLVYGPAGPPPVVPVRGEGDSRTIGPSAQSCIKLKAPLVTTMASMPVGGTDDAVLVVAALHPEQLRADGRDHFDVEPQPIKLRQNLQEVLGGHRASYVHGSRLRRAIAEGAQDIRATSSSKVGRDPERGTVGDLRWPGG